MRRALLVSVLLHLTVLYFILNLSPRFPMPKKKETPKKYIAGLYAYIPPYYPKLSRPEPSERRGGNFGSKAKGPIKPLGRGRTEGKNYIGKEKGEGNYHLPEDNRGNEKNASRFATPSEIGKFIPKGEIKFRPRGASATGGAVFESGTYDITPWAEKVIRKIKENWYPPLALELGIKGLSVIRIIVLKDGKVPVLEIERPSGIKAYDEAAKDAVENSLPFPSLPHDYPYINLVGHLYFYYNLGR